MKNPSYASQEEQGTTLLWFNALAALLILGGGAFSRGLYFPQEFLVVNAIIGLLSLIAFPVLLGNRKFKLDLLDGAVLAMGLAYTITIFGAANVGNAILEAMRVWTYVLYYFILSRSLRRQAIVNFYAKGLIVIGVIVALFGILTVPGWINYIGSWTGGVLSSVLQYHNAFASFIVGIMILAVYFWLEEKKFIQGALFGAGIFIMAFSVAGSQSRGGYLIFLAAVLAMFFIFPAGKRKDLVFPVLNFLAGLLLWSRFLAAANAKSSGMAVVWLVAGCVWAVLLTLAKNNWGILWDKYPKKTVNTVLAVIAVLCVGAGAFVFMRHGGDVLTTIKRINWQAHSVQERFVFYQNAWQMFLQRPLLGYGGGGWMDAYKGFQSYLYYSTETHSIITKILVETGLVGIAVLLILVVALVRVVVKTAKTLKADMDAKAYLNHIANAKVANQASLRIFNSVVFLSFLAVGGHALIDFDLSEGAVSLLLWGTLALIKGIQLYKDQEDWLGVQPGRRPNSALNRNASYPGGGNRAATTSPGVSATSMSANSSQSNNEMAKKPSPFQGLGDQLGMPVMLFLTIISAALLIAPYFIWNGMKSSDATAVDIQRQDFPKAVQDSQTAINSFPFDAQSWAEAAQANMYMLMSNRNSQYQQAAIADINKATDLDKYDPTIWTIKAGILGSLGQNDQAYAAAQKIIPLAPFYNKSYESYGQAALNYGLYELQSGNKAKATEVVKEVAAIPQQIKNKVDNLNPKYKKLWIVPDKLEATSVIRFRRIRLNSCWEIPRPPRIWKPWSMISRSANKPFCGWQV